MSVSVVVGAQWGDEAEKSSTCSPMGRIMSCATRAAATQGTPCA